MKNSILPSPWKVLLGLVLLSTTFGYATPLPQASRKKLDNDIRYLVGQHGSYGQFAVAVVDQAGVVSQVNGDKPYPLASVFKLPLLLAILERQEAGTFPGPGTSLPVTRSDQCIGSGKLADQGVGASVTIARACELMMSISDNTATDLLFRKLGPQNLDPWLKKVGLLSSEIILTNRQAWLLSLGVVPGWGKTTPEDRVKKWEQLDRGSRLQLADKIERSAEALSLAQFQAIENASTGTQSAYQDDLLAARLDNKMSALDLGSLLVKLDSGVLLSPQGRERAFKIIGGQQYHSRLPKKLAPNTRVFHKTGTVSGVRNDAGILYPDRRREGVAVIFLSQHVASGAGTKVDNLAAQIAKLVEKAYSQG